MIFWRSWWSRSHRRAEPGRGATTQAACRQRGVLRSCGCGRGRGHDGRSGARWRQLGSERRGSPAHRPGRWARAVWKSGVCLKETLDGALHEPARLIDGGDGGERRGGERWSSRQRCTARSLGDRLGVGAAASQPACSGTSGTSGFFLHVGALERPRQASACAGLRQPQGTTTALELGPCEGNSQTARRGHRSVTGSS